MSLLPASCTTLRLVAAGKKHADQKLSIELIERWECCFLVISDAKRKNVLVVVYVYACGLCACVMVYFEPEMGCLLH